MQSQYYMILREARRFGPPIAGVSLLRIASFCLCLAHCSARYYRVARAIQLASSVKVWRQTHATTHDHDCDLVLSTAIRAFLLTLLHLLKVLEINVRWMVGGSHCTNVLQ